MSELDLIKKLEKLSAEKPKKEWVDFTRESILATTPVIEERNFWQSLRVREFAPMMICIFSALIIGGFISSPQGNEPGLMTAQMGEIENYTASIITTTQNNNEEEPAIEEEPVIASNPIINNDVVEEVSLSTLMSEGDKEAITKEMERTLNGVKECKRLEEQGLLEEESNAKKTCDELEDRLNNLSQYLSEEGE